MTGDAPPMRLHDVFDNRKTKARSPQFLGARLVDPEKPFKNTALGFFRNPYSRISDCDRHTLRIVIRKQNNLSSRLVKFDRVVDKVYKNLVDLVAITGHYEGFPGNMACDRKFIFLDSSV